MCKQVRAPSKQLYKITADDGQSWTEQWLSQDDVGKYELLGFIVVPVKTKVRCPDG